MKAIIYDDYEKMEVDTECLSDLASALEFKAESPFSVCDRRIYEAAAEIIRIQAKKVKYRWHDLRKNPNDLPDVERVVECIYESEKHDIAYIYQNKWYSDFNNEYVCNVGENDVIAWRYVETLASAPEVE